MTSVPAISLVCGILLLAGVVGLWLGRRTDGRRNVAAISLAAVILAGGCLIALPSSSDAAPGRLIDDGFSRFFAGTAILLAAFWIVVGASGRADGERSEGFALIALLACGTIVTASAATLPGLFAGLAMVFLAIHAPLWEIAPPEEQAGRLRSLLFPAAVLTLLLMGMTILAALAKTTTLSHVGVDAPIPAWGAAFSSPWMVLSLVLIGVSLLSLSIVTPWTLRNPARPDLTETWVGGVWLTLPRVAALAAFLRLLPQTLAVGASEAAPLMLVLSIGSLLISAGAAARREALRPLLSAVATAAAAFWLVGIAVACWESGLMGQPPAAESGLPRGMTAALFCAACDLCAIAGLFAVLRYLTRADRRSAFVEDLAGLIRTEPWGAIAMTICLLSLTGVPPTPGFWGRFWLMTSVFRPRHMSSLTGLYDVHVGYLLIAAAALVHAAALIMIVMRLLEVVLLRDPIGRITPIGGRPAFVAALASLATLAMLSVQPFALLRVVDAAIGGRAVVALTPPTDPAREGSSSSGVSLHSDQSIEDALAGKAGVRVYKNPVRQ